METIQVTGVMEKLGVKSETITSGQFKDIFSPFRDMRPEERALLQKMVMEVYEQFVAEVVKGRPKLTEAQIRRLADGRVFNGEEANRLGLIDELGGFEKAVTKAMVLATGTQPTEPPHLIFEDGKGGFLQRLLSGESFSPSSLLPKGGLKYLYRPGL
jgi:protease-4